MTTGAGRQLAAQHSQSLEGWYAHIPGIRVLAPATVEDARHMLAPALADPDPVLVFEHGSLYNASGELSAPAAPGDIDHAAVRRPGTDDWLSAGQALERVLLLATLHGLATSLTSHARESRDPRWLARAPTAMAYVQIVVRLGYGPEGPATPRRPVRDVLDID